MKTLTNSKVTISDDGKTATIVADISDVKFDMVLMQRVTIGHLNPANMRHPRHVQISNEAVFVKAFGNGFAIPLDDIVAIAAAVEPKTSFAPVFKKSTSDLTVEISSELNPDFQWQASADGKTWNDIAGQTSKTLDPKTVSTGQLVRCVASSDAGSMASNPIKIK